MKRVRDWPAAKSILSWTIGAYVKLVGCTLRWETDDKAVADTAAEGAAGLMVLFWHGQIVLALAGRVWLKKKPTASLISRSRDGDLIADIALRLGISAIRGSSGRSGGDFSKGGAAAFREAKLRVTAGEALLITPDGPRGPREVMSKGAVALATAARCPVFLMGLAATPSFTLKNWDRTQLPLPFARAFLTLEGPLQHPGELRSPDREAVRLAWQSRLQGLQCKALAAVQAKASEPGTSHDPAA